MSSIDALAAQLSQTQLAIAQSVLKLAAQSDQAIANLLADAANVPVSSSLGTQLNISV